MIIPDVLWRMDLVRMHKRGSLEATAISQVRGVLA